MQQIFITWRYAASTLARCGLGTRKLGEPALWEMLITKVLIIYVDCV